MLADNDRSGSRLPGPAGVPAGEAEVADAEVLMLGRWSTDSEEFEHPVTASNASVAAVKPRVGYNVRRLRTVQP